MSRKVEKFGGGCVLGIIVRKQNLGVTMIKYLQVPIGKYGSITVEIEPTSDTSGFEELGIQKVKPEPSSSFEELGAKERVRKAAQTVTVEATNAFDKMSETIQVVVYGFRDRMSQIEQAVQPDEASVEFGLALKADAGVVVAQAGADASFKIKLIWKSLAREG